MLVVIEGCDGTGKTTLAENLAGRLGAEILHLGPPKRHPLEETVLALDDYEPGSGRDVIVDRFHLGELIYGPIYRGESQLGPKFGPGHKWVDMWLLSRGAITVVLDAPLETIRERIGVRGDDFVKDEHLGRIRGEYFDLAHSSPIAPTTFVHRYPPFLAPQNELHDAIIYDGRLLEAGVLGAFEATDGRWCGSAHPDVLLVGDETSPTHLSGKRPRYRAPFVPYRGSSGWHLFDVLSRKFLRRSAIVNSAEVDLPKAHAKLAPKHTIALGTLASERLKAEGVSHTPTTHPQFVRRFHHMRLSAWGTHVEALGHGRELSW